MSERIPAGGPYRALSGMHEPLTLDSIREARRMLSIYCRQIDEFCENYVSIVSRAAEKIARIRAEELMESGDYKGLDRNLFDVIKMVLDVYAKYIAGFLVTWGDLVVTQLMTDIEMGGKRYEKGEIALLPLHEAAVLSAVGLARVFESIALAELRSKQSAQKS